MGDSTILENIDQLPDSEILVKYKILEASFNDLNMNYYSLEAKIATILNELKVSNENTAVLVRQLKYLKEENLALKKLASVACSSQNKLNTILNRGEGNEEVLDLQKNEDADNSSLKGGSKLENVNSQRSAFTSTEPHELQSSLKAEDNGWSLLKKATVSKPAPYWEATAVVNGAFQQLKLTNYRGKFLVFFFYPLDFTFVCPTEILAFSDRIEEFRKIDTEVVACSVDSHFTHLAWINTPRKEGGLGNISIPLLSDLTHQISKDYGVLLEDLGHTLRGLFIIDPKGLVRQITMNDLPVGRSVDETLRLVQAFKFTDEYGEVCPMGWKPGQDTIIPDPIEKKKYFENH